MKLFYTEKEMQKEIERRMGEYERDRWNAERFDRLEKRCCEMENVIDGLATRFNRHVDTGDMCKGTPVGRCDNG